MTSLELTQMYYQFIKDFEINNGRVFTHTEFIRWLYRVSPNNPYKDDWTVISDHLVSSKDSSELDSAKKVAQQWRNRFVSLASRCPEPDAVLEDTHQICTDPNGEDESVFETLIIGKHWPILPAKWRREIYYDKKKKLWVIAKLGNLLTHSDASRDTVTQEAMGKLRSTVRKHRKRNKRAEDADAIGDLHATCRGQTVAIRGLEDKLMDNHLDVFEQMLESDVEKDIEKVKQGALEHSEAMKQKDKRIRELEQQLGIE